MTFDANRPIFKQIISDFKRKLASGSLKSGERVPPVRELALEYGVNPNTMQKALSELEREGLLRSERTSGRSVTADGALIERLKTDEQAAATLRYIGEMTALGAGRGQIGAMLNEFLTDEQEER
jgi:DNA-binding transcriptional regulator YhcF (GntR family)